MWRIFTYCVSCLLFVSAISKGVSLINDPYLHPVFSPVLQSIVVGLELALAFFLISGQQPRFAKWSIVGLFALMTNRLWMFW